jgi:hypothetical protein
MAFDITTLDAPFQSLTAYDWGADAAFLKAIDAAVIAAQADAALQAELEKRFAAVLGGGASRATKEYVCRKLMMIGTKASVPALAVLLPDKDLSHMARFALERVPGPEAAAALRDALGKAEELLKVGMISSLAARRDSACVPALAACLKASPVVAMAAAGGLGTIGSPEAITVLAAADPFAAGGVGAAVANARLACAESLLAGGKRDEAIAIYRALAEAAADKPHAKALQMAATRGILACADTLATTS